MVSNDSLLVCEEFAFTYPSEEPPFALSNISFDLRAHECLFVCGHNGSGKSTLLKAIAGILESTGTCKFRNRSNNLWQAWSEVANQHMVLVPQDIRDVLPVDVRIDEFARLAGEHTLRELVEETGAAWLSRNGKKLDRRLIGDLSGGQRIFFMLLSAIATGGTILLFDEVFRPLDSQRQKAIGIALIASLRKRRQAAIVVSHDLSVVKTLADAVLILRGGRPAAYWRKEHGPVDNFLEANTEAFAPSI